jgi:hypothetical protein
MSTNEKLRKTTCKYTTMSHLIIIVTHPKQLMTVQVEVLQSVSSVPRESWLTITTGLEPPE